jgi:DNA-binding MarR family transcriptional regulator
MERLARESDEGLSLRASHFAVFPHLTIEGDRVNALAEKVDVTKQSMSQTLFELEEHGIVRRVPDPSDGRARLVQLTAEGIRKFGEGLQLLGEVEEELKPVLSAEDLAELRALLVQVIEVFADSD